MGRPGSSRADKFTSREMAIAADLTPRNFALVCDQNLGPSPEDEIEGRGGHKLYAAPALAHAALVGAINLAGFELLVSARLAKAFADDSADTHGKLHSNLGVYLERPCNPTPGYFPWSRRLDPINSEDDFWLHERLRNHTSLYQSGVALLGDFIIDIADHHHVLTEHLSDRPIPVFSPASGRLPANPEYRIVGRGGVARIIRPSDELDDFNVFSNPKAKRQMQTLERRYLDARANAVSLVRINVSLAIRNALDRLQNFREEKRAA